MSKRTATETKNAIRGPVFPIPTPFKQADDSVDHVAIARYVDFLVGEGAPVILVTVGTSRFNLLSTEEMLAVNKTVVEAVGGRAVAIAAGPPQGSFKDNLDFAKTAGEFGADAIMVFYPERHYGDGHVFDFYKMLAEQSPVGVMIHEMPMRNGFAGGPVQFSLDLLDRLTDLPNLIGLKEECGDADYAYKLLRRIAGKTALIGAGSKRKFLRDYHAGAISYLVGIGNFLPRLSLDFYAAVMAEDFEKAHRIVRENEEPFFDPAVALGWHRSLKEALDIFGLLPAHERPPMSRVPVEGREKLRAIAVQCGWLK